MAIKTIFQNHNLEIYHRNKKIYLSRYLNTSKESFNSENLNPRRSSLETTINPKIILLGNKINLKIKNYLTR
jgi:hypothetical protein